MSLTLDELTQCEERLQTEIVERECLLAAVRVLRGHAAKGQSLATLDLSGFGSALGMFPTPVVLPPSAAHPMAEPVAAPTPPPPEKPYVHPELERLWPKTNVACVEWALGKLPEEFSLRNVQQLLQREGNPLVGSQISVVLGRLKAAGRIREIRPSAGPNPALFRKPAAPKAAVAEPEDSPVAATA